MTQRLSRLYYRAEMREPYMGNMVAVRINILVDEDGYIQGVEVLSPEGILTRATHLTLKDVQ